MALVTVTPACGVGQGIRPGHGADAL